MMNTMFCLLFTSNRILECCFGFAFNKKDFIRNKSNSTVYVFFLDKQTIKLFSPATHESFYKITSKRNQRSRFKLLKDVKIRRILVIA